jgi:hypothetical protein
MIPLQQHVVAAADWPFGNERTNKKGLTTVIFSVDNLCESGLL